MGAWVINRLLIQPAANRAFGGVYVYVDPAALRLRYEAELPTIFCLTHTNWWDGYMAQLLNRSVFKKDGYLMMEEINLARYPFFTWIGVFGVDRDDPRKALLSIDYAANLLHERRDRAIWMFPQGHDHPPGYTSSAPVRRCCQSRPQSGKVRIGAGCHALRVSHGAGSRCVRSHWSSYTFRTLRPTACPPKNLLCALMQLCRTQMISCTPTSCAAICISTGASSLGEARRTKCGIGL